MADGSLTLDTKLDTTGYEKGLGSLEGITNKFGAVLKGAFTIGAAAVGTATTAIAALTKASVTSYASLEQNIGGIETLFEDLSDDIIENANKAYDTAGMSANTYYETVMSFGASLNQSLKANEGNIARAAKLADQTIIDMSDNANKMGTDLTAITTAYQGFAKQNYTMLDNLKLGYGGTKQEMERLLKDAQKLTGQKYDVSNFADISEAIHAIQVEMGITGTTMKEGTETISGSIGRLKASFDNFLNGSGDLSVVLNNVKIVILNVSNAIKKLIPTLIKDIVNSLPEMLEMGAEIVREIAKGINDNLDLIMETTFTIISTLFNGLMENLDKILDFALQLIIKLIDGLNLYLPKLFDKLPEIVDKIAQGLIDNAPSLLRASLQLILTLVKGLADNLPKFLEMAPVLVSQLCDELLDNMDKFVPIAVEIVVTLAKTIVKNLPTLMTMGVRMIYAVIQSIIEHLPELWEQGKQIIYRLADGIRSRLEDVKNAAVDIGNRIKDTIRDFINQAWQWGADMIQGFINGIRSKVNAVGDAANSVANKVKSFLHFSRPDVGPLRDYETWMPDMVKGLVKTLHNASPLLAEEANKLASQLQMAVDMQQSKFLINSGVNRELKLNLNVEGGDMYLDSERVGQILAPSISNAIMNGGAY